MLFFLQSNQKTEQMELDSFETNVASIALIFDKSSAIHCQSTGHSNQTNQLIVEYSWPGININTILVIMYYGFVGVFINFAFGFVLAIQSSHPIDRNLKVESDNFFSICFRESRLTIRNEAELAFQCFFSTICKRLV